ncbi:MAG: hypothetical protein FJY09_02435 [Chlorobi bacterium]|nr:hypothetical protein [Chlorobiota bacterium]
MKPVCINNYCFDRIHTWIQYDWRIPQFIEVVIEVFYPKNLDANGLVMFSHGFLIGNDLLFYPKKIVGAFLDDNPLFGINPSAYYNYSAAIVEKNWAMAFVTASHMQSVAMPWVDFGGNPRVGQDAYAAASYLIKYGATDEFYKIDEQNRNRSFFEKELAGKTRFMKSNNVIFAGHSVGGAHAQVAAVGFDNLQAIGKRTSRPFDPVLYDREFLPLFSCPMSQWREEHRAKPVGLIQLSPVDMNVPCLAPGMKPYRETLAAMQMPSLMVIGNCDCATLRSSSPKSWSSDPKDETQFTQLSSSGSWAAVTRVDKGSHCGYLTEKSLICETADMHFSCSLCPDIEVYPPQGAEMVFTTELFRRFIRIYNNTEPFKGSFSDWKESSFMQWLNKPAPQHGTVDLAAFDDGEYVDYAGNIS